MRTIWRVQIGRSCLQSAIACEISLDSVSVKAQTNNTQGALSNERIAKSKEQKGNKENKKPKTDKIALRACPHTRRREA